MAKKKISKSKESSSVKVKEEVRPEKVKIKAYFIGGKVATEKTDPSRELYNKSRFGALLDDDKVQLSLLESLYLMEKKRVVLLDGRGKEISVDSFIKKAQRLEPNFWVRYCVFKDMRNRGYIIKTALKFGADFRVYDRGIKPGEDHAKWIVYPVYEAEKYTWYDFAAKNRVAHSTKKRLLMAIVDEENDCTYYEVSWKRP